MHLAAGKWEYGPACSCCRYSQTYTITGTTCVNCLVEVYSYSDTVLQYLGKTVADAGGAFIWESCTPVAGQQVAALTIDASGNTSPFPCRYL
jgi:hypothetical protein